MGRMSGFEWMERQSPITRPRKLSKAEAEAIINRHVKRVARIQGYIDPSKPKYTWAWSFQGQDGVVEANTRGEAKALIKELLGVPSSHRLPVGVAVRRLEENTGRSLTVSARLEKKRATNPS